jgi:predicted O-methyltransferase YrrM
MSLPTIHRSMLGVKGYTRRPYMQEGEQDVIVALLNSVEPRTVVEIGVNVGLTASALLREVKTIEVYFGIDVSADYRFELPAQQRERPAEPGHLVKHDPRFRLLLRDLDEMPDEADAVFIDGDHGERSVRQDSLWAARIVKPGGMIIWHDYGNPTVEVTPVLDQLRDEGRNLYHVSRTWLAFEQR